jgi:hypothetical protein
LDKYFKTRPEKVEIFAPSQYYKYINPENKGPFVQKSLNFLFFTAVSLMAISCSNFVLPERVHIKAGVNPNIPVKSEDFNFTEKIQEQLAEMFDKGDEQIRIINYTGDKTSNIQKFLISFSLHEQSLDFQEYLSEDLDLNASFGAIKQTFTLDKLSTADGKIFVDMSKVITNILNKITFPAVPVPVLPGSSALPPLDIPVQGFTSLSFYSGYIEVTFSMPSGQNNTVTLSNLKINSIPSGQSTYTLNAGNTTVTATFPLTDQTLTSPLALSVSYSANFSGSLNTAIKFSNDVKLKTAKGVSFDAVSGQSLGEGAGDIISLDGLPPEFVQGTVKEGSITLDTSAIKGISLDLSNASISQQDNAANPSYEGASIKEGLNISGPGPGQQFISLAGKKINSGSVKTTGAYSASVSDGGAAEITFSSSGALEIPVSFDLQSFSAIYINGQKIIDDFNNGSDSKIEIPLGDLSKTVNSIKINKIGAELTFGETAISGLDLTVTSGEFEVNKKHPVEKGVKEFTNDAPFTYDLTGNPVNFTLEFSAANSGTIPILMLPDITAGKEISIIDCQPRVIFDWAEAVINPSEGGTGNDFASGEFPKKGDDPFSLGDSEDLEKFLKGFEFEKINGYLFFSGPPLDAEGITLTLKREGDSGSIWDGPISIGQNVPKLPEAGKSFETDIANLNADGVNGPMDFASTLNAMLKGENLRIEYSMDFGNGITIKKEDLAEEGAKVFKADLALVLPLSLTAGTNGATIDVTEYLGEIAGKDLLSFTKDIGNMDVSFNTLTLNVGLTGALMEGGSLAIERDANKDGVQDPSFSVPLSGKNVSIKLADHLGPSQKFTLKSIKLKIDPDGRLKIPQELSLVSVSVNAGVDVIYDF